MTGKKPTQKERLDRLELAVATMAQWLVQAQTGFNANDAQGIEKILAGEIVPDKPTETPLSPVPTCPECGEKMSNTHTRLGVPHYTCVNLSGGCTNKKSYSQDGAQLSHLN